MRGVKASVLLAVSGLLAGPALAGPVGAYLGYEVGRTAAMHRFGRDSAHIFLPTPSDTVFRSDGYDTTFVVAETLYEGNPAWLLARSESLVAADTAVESGDTLLRQKFDFMNVSLWANAWRVPFSVGTWWRTGLEGTYYLDLNGDSLLDTLTIWGDTTRVDAVEDVAVPFDTLRDCFRVHTVLRQALGMVDTGIPLRESSYVQMWWWYKDSLWIGRDSSSITARAYARLIIWLKVADIQSDRIGELVNVYTGVAEPPAGRPEPGIAAWPNPARGWVDVRLSDGLAQSCPELRDASGRALAVPVNRRGSVFRLGLAHLAPGVYFVRAGTEQRKLVRAR